MQSNLLEVDERTDVYGLGATLYEMATLAPIFDGDTTNRLIEQVLHQEPEVAPSDRARDPEQTSPRSPCIASTRTGRRDTPTPGTWPRTCDGSATAFPCARPLSGPQRFVRWCRRNRSLAAAAGLAAALLLAVVVLSVVIAIQQTNAVERVRKEQLLTKKARSERLAKADAVSARRSTVST